MPARNVNVRAEVRSQNSEVRNTSEMIIPELIENGAKANVEFIFDSFMFYLPVFMLVNSLHPVVDDLFFIALFALFWAAGFAYKFLPAGFVYRFLPKPKKKEKVLKETTKELPPKEVKASILDKSRTFLRKYVCSNCGTELDNESVRKCPHCKAELEKFVPQNQKKPIFVSM